MSYLRDARNLIQSAIDSVGIGATSVHWVPDIDRSDITARRVLIVPAKRVTADASRGSTRRTVDISVKIVEPVDTDSANVESQVDTMQADVEKLESIKRVGKWSVISMEQPVPVDYERFREFRLVTTMLIFRLEVVEL